MNIHNITGVRMLLVALGGYLFIFLARICDVSMATLRVLMVVRGKRLQAALIGFFEAIIYIVILNQVFATLNDNPYNLLFYAAGFATGTYVGGFFEEKLAVGIVTVQIITLKSPLEFTAMLREAGFGVTVIEGTGREGTRYILQIILQRKSICLLRNLIDEWDQEAFWTIFDARYAHGGFFLRKGK